MAQVALFKSRMSSCFHVLRNGKYLYFINSQLTLDKQKEIDELLQEIEDGNNNIYQEKGRELIDSAELDPIAALRAKHFAEFKAQQEAALNPDADRGTTKQGNINPQNSRDVAAATANGVVSASLQGNTIADTTANAGGAKSIDLGALKARFAQPQ